MTTPTNIADHGWLASDNLSDCAANIAYWTGQISTPGGEIFTADSVTTVPVTIQGNGTTQTGDLLDVLQNHGGNSVFKVATVTAAATGLQVTSAAAASRVTLSVTSSGTNEGLTVTPKGTGTVVVTGGAATAPGAALTVAGVSTGVNGLTVTNAAAGNSPIIAATGSDSNVNVTLTPKGAGLVNFGGPALSVGNTGATGTLARVGTNATGPSGTASVGWLPVATAGTAGFVPVWQ